MANTFITPDIVAREALLLLRSNLVGTLLFDRRYDGIFTGDEKVGDTVRIRRRQDGEVTEFSGTVTPGSTTETSINLTLEKHFDASFEVTTKDLTLNIQDFSEQVLAPRLIAMAEKVDQYCMSKLHNLPYVATVDTLAGTAADIPDNLPNSIAALAQTRKTLNVLRVPLTNRIQIVSPDYEATLLSVENFITADKRGDGGSALESASLGRVMGMDFFMDQNVISTSFTSGTFTTGVTNGATAAGSYTVAIDGTVGASDTLKTGDLLNIAGYGNVVVASDVAASTNAVTVTLTERLRVAVADGVAVTKAGASGEVYQRHGAAFHPRAFAFVSAPLVIPPEAEGVMLSYEGLSIRAVRSYDLLTKKSIMSLDCLVGAAVVDPRLGAQVIVEV